MRRDRELTEFALNKKLEVMKRLLRELIHQKKGDLLDQEIIELSQHIDKIINRLQTMKKNDKTNSNTAKLAR